MIRTPIIICNYCGFLEELNYEDGPCSSVYDIVLRDIRDPRITIHMEGIMPNEINPSI